MSVNLIIGASHKTYFSYQQTQEWCEHVADIVKKIPDDIRHSLETFTFPAIPTVSLALQYFRETTMFTGAQDICHAPAGSWTGESSAAMFREMGCLYAEIGHAERRRYFGETTDIIRQKIERAFESGLIPVICIGEPEKMSAEQASEYAITQAYDLLSSFSRDMLSPVIFAWEPQWAIGAAQPASDEYIQTVCRTLRDSLRHEYESRCSVIYGGSAGPGLLTRLWPDVDGIFLGRFAHNPQAMESIIDEAVRILRSEQNKK